MITSSNDTNTKTIIAKGKNNGNASAVKGESKFDGNGNAAAKNFCLVIFNLGLKAKGAKPENGQNAQTKETPDQTATEFGERLAVEGIMGLGVNMNMDSLEKTLAKGFLGC